MKVIITEQQLANIMQSDESMTFDRNAGTYRWEDDKLGKNINTTRTTRDEQGKVQLKYFTRTLPNSQVNSYNLYDISNFRVTQALKHGKVDFGGQEPEKVIPEDSIEQFKDYTAKYILRILNHQKKIVDVILTPQSSSNFNEDIANRIKTIYAEQYQKDIMVEPNAFIKTPETAKIDVEKGMEYIKKDVQKFYKDDTEEQLEKKLVKVIQNINNMAENWEIEGKLKPFVDLINDLYKTKNSLLNSKKIARGDESLIKDIDNAVNTLVTQWNTEIGKERLKQTRYFHYGKLQPEPKPFQIKHLPDAVRRCITNLFTLTDRLDKPYGNDPTKVSKLIDRLKRNNKTIMIFDDNLSSGTTMDNIADHLIQNGINKDNILVFTLGVAPQSTYNRYEKLYKV